MEAEEAVGEAFQRLCEATGVYPAGHATCILDALRGMMDEAKTKKLRHGKLALVMIFALALAYANDAVWWIDFARIQRITSLRSLAAFSA